LEELKKVLKEHPECNLSPTSAQSKQLEELKLWVLPAECKTLVDTYKSETSVVRVFILATITSFIEFMENPNTEKFSDNLVLRQRWNQRLVNEKVSSLLEELRGVMFELTKSHVLAFQDKIPWVTPAGVTESRYAGDISLMQLWPILSEFQRKEIRNVAKDCLFPLPG